MSCQAACCKDIAIKPLHLIMPHLMSEDGRAFVEAHGINDTVLLDLQEDATLLDDGQVLIKHVCQHLGGDNRCDIYATRPKLCRDFECSTRFDCDGPCG